MKIAIVKLSALGDIIHAMVVLQFIKKFNNEILIDWIVEENYKELFENNPNINKLHVVNIKKAKNRKSPLALLKELNKVSNMGPYDLVVDMQGLIKSAIISRLIPSKRTIGFDKNSLREGLASVFYNEKFKCKYSKNVVIRNNELIQFSLGFFTDKDKLHSKSPFLFSRNNVFQGCEISNTKKNILIVPGASNKLKQYPPNKLAELVNIIDANFLISWGTTEEKRVAEEIKNLAPRSSICNELSLSMLVSLVSQMDLVIGPDTGPTHIAWALNVPSVTIFGPTSGKRNSFITDINKIIESDSKVNPNNLNKKDSSIKTISVNEIVKIANNLLNNQSINQ